MIFPFTVLEDVYFLEYALGCADGVVLLEFLTVAQVVAIVLSYLIALSRETRKYS